jgi:hypothetical protein
MTLFMVFFLMILLYESHGGERGVHEYGLEDVVQLEDYKSKWDLFQWS